jgi:hypothetical protein
MEHVGMGSALGDRGLLGWTRNGKILGWPWPGVVGALLIYIGLLGLMFHGIDSLMDARVIPHYEYRLVTPAEAMPMVNEQGWRVSERIRMTDQAVYLYRQTR